MIKWIRRFSPVFVLVNSMRLIDTHVHLNHDDLYQQLDEVLARAASAQVYKLVVIGYDYESSKRAIEIAERFDHVFAVVGVHPTEVEISPSIDTLLPHPKVVAIGEIGLDYHWDTVAKNKQIEAFIRQIDLAHAYQLPIIIHMRDATEDTIEVLRKKKSELHQGIMHCYGGSVESMKHFLDLGFYISLGGPVTFKNAVTPKEVAKKVPIDRLVIETDSPYLAPHPYRGKQNESSFLPLIAESIANIRNITIEELADATTKNAERLLKI